MIIDVILSLIPLVPPSVLLVQLLNDLPNMALHMVKFVCMALLGFAATNNLVPKIKTYTLRKGIAGKDLGKRGTPLQDEPVPEALGIVPGVIFLICIIIDLVWYANTNPEKLLDCTAALLSICFMLFLGFTDDVLDWPWRYKLLLPTIASLPLLCCYNGSTSIVVPIQLRSLLMHGEEVTALGGILDYVIEVDRGAAGSIVNLGLFYYVYMGLLAVFCTNAINIYAGINGLEVGQSFVIGCAVILHNLIEVRHKSLSSENHLFSLMITMSFVGVTLGLLRHNWYPASVFVGDTYCYFAGMTFAVVGILGHFSKTLLLFFLPQICNFLYSTPQLFKFVPCPRHRLPYFDAGTGLMSPSTFPCKSHEFRWLKCQRDDTVCPNLTVINLALRVVGPMTERRLCLVLLTLQVVCCGIGFYIRYYLAQYFFHE
mmetsp:Transcript_27561/g.33464  ORF Transcript_27561/g.33464 Transcript_27561/m.33464 type:complete len:428 (-) Transcript_27561:580-1863(-)